MKYKLEWQQWVILAVLTAVFAYFAWYSYNFNKEYKARPENWQTSSPQ